MDDGLLPSAIARLPCRVTRCLLGQRAMGPKRSYCSTRWAWKKGTTARPSAWCRHDRRALCYVPRRDQLHACQIVAVGVWSSSAGKDPSGLPAVPREDAEESLLHYRSSMRTFYPPYPHPHVFVPRSRNSSICVLRALCGRSTSRTSSFLPASRVRYDAHEHRTQCAFVREHWN
jgi:hypothetical protein